MNEKPNPTSFADLITTSDVPVLVDFWAEWCAPCRTIGPLVKQLAHEYSGRLVTVKVNIDKKPDVAQQYQVAGIPTIMMFWKGQEVLRIVGMQPIDAIRQKIQAHLPTK